MRDGGVFGLVTSFACPHLISQGFKDSNMDPSHNCF